MVSLLPKFLNEHSITILKYFIYIQFASILSRESFMTFVFTRIKSRVANYIWLCLYNFLQSRTVLLFAPTINSLKSHDYCSVECSTSGIFGLFHHGISFLSNIDSKKFSFWVIEVSHISSKTFPGAILIFSVKKVHLNYRNIVVY